MPKNAPEYLYHYTSISALAQILSNKSIRFSSLPNLDDLEESKIKLNVNWGNFCFISSWMGSETESIPMWSMYSKNLNGVRIGLPPHPFKTYAIHSSEFAKCVYNVNQTEHGVLPLKDDILTNSIVSASEYFNESYNFAFNKDFDLLRVVYTDSLKTLDCNKFTDDGKSSVDLMSFGKYKRNAWKFQNEWRYRVFIFPLAYRLMSLNKDSDLWKVLYWSSIRRPSKLPFSYYDFSISDESFSKMIITLGPNCNDGDKKIVSLLQDKYNPDAAIRESTLSGKIR